MAIYIDVLEAEAAIKDLFADMPRIEFMDNRRRWREENEQYLRCLDVLRSLPTSDVVEVVRCKDCKYYKPWEGTTLFYCSYTDNAYVVRRKEDYCSRGVLEDDESHPFADDVMMGERKDDDKE